MHYSLSLTCLLLRYNLINIDDILKNIDINSLDGIFIFKLEEEFEELESNIGKCKRDIGKLARDQKNLIISLLQMHLKI